MNMISLKSISRFAHVRHAVICVACSLASAGCRTRDVHAALAKTTVSVCDDRFRVQVFNPCTQPMLVSVDSATKEHLTPGGFHRSMESVLAEARFFSGIWTLLPENDGLVPGESSRNLSTIVMPVQNGSFVSTRCFPLPFGPACGEESKQPVSNEELTDGLSAAWVAEKDRIHICLVNDGPHDLFVNTVGFGIEMFGETEGVCRWKTDGLLKPLNTRGKNGFFVLLGRSMQLDDGRVSRHPRMLSFRIPLENIWDGKPSVRIDFEVIDAVDLFRSSCCDGTSSQSRHVSLVAENVRDDTTSGFPDVRGWRAWPLIVQYCLTGHDVAVYDASVKSGQGARSVSVPSSRVFCDLTDDDVGAAFDSVSPTWTLPPPSRRSSVSLGVDFTPTGDNSDEGNDEAIN